jgi:diguanylate cyclase (GGDEF)-like protein
VYPVLDIVTMRVALGGVSILVTILFYLGVYRPTRSEFAGWWTIGLLCSGGSATLLMLNGTAAQAIANPASSVLSAIGATCVWFATRSLRGGRSPVWLLPVSAAAIAVFAALGNPATNTWAGNGPLFGYMAAMFIFGSIEMWRCWLDRRTDNGEARSTEAQVALLVSALAASTLAVLYTLRVILFATIGHEHPTFQTLVGTGVTTAVLLLTLVAVTFSASTIGWDQSTRALRRRAISDDLTGLLGRSEFWKRAGAIVSRRGVRVGDVTVLVLADLDHFKTVNDQYGHAAGDEAIRAFARHLRAHLGRRELAGRLGGEEFALMLVVTTVEDAEHRVAQIARSFAHEQNAFDFPLPTVSFGLAAADIETTVDALFESADAALYQAKDNGRAQTVVAVSDTH